METSRLPRNRVIRSWVALCGPLLLAVSLPLSAASLVINTEDYPPFNYASEQGQIIGSATKVLRTALRSADIDAEFRLLPWARAYTAARLREQHCVYSTTRTAEREPLFRWAGPLAVNEWAAFRLTGRDIKVSSTDELANFRVGSFREDAVGNYIAAQGIKVLRARNERENLARLSAGLVDIIVTGKATGEYLANAQDVALTHLFTFYRAPLYLACHPSVPKHVITRLQHHLPALSEASSP
ncbi:MULTISPECIES: substrate-binding periplasmic protein [unclassified Halomonas]|uniref:substrate-binding periplasmic protein n=1 Tax=unclassified Halomonas TaxID=2609666 RepID=UPI0006DB97CB|nr:MULTISPECIES: transporter substrate-binding domain-containing protein [unclassified Halomonas]KPQ20454.1 MAG: ABC-type polar amino acid uptake system substrate-binding component [Halomonas sp. HL-93]SBR46306.1 amino acid ABC transporter substrate-binding protein, PAAT family [Halomonas sp. HL-93]SNY98691.1 amino acid ABC transporter substrate-binding protein, PAAT family [Halomonas sp. hl-4]